MSAAPASAAPDRRSPDYMRVLGLVKEIGSKNGFEPIPRDQLGWQRGIDQPPLQRMWAWLLSKTLYKGHWSPYACTKQAQDGGEELHIEHAAKALGMDVANAYRTWREGVARGLWRNGTKEEGKRKLFICGSVPQPVEAQSVGEEKGKQIVCTDNFPPYILNEINKWAPEKQQQFWQEWAVRVEVRNVTLAELVKAGRLVLTEQDDTHLSAWGLEKRRQDHPALKKVAGREARIAVVLPEVRQSVLTILELVQSSKKAVYRPENGRVQTTPTLLPETSIREKLRQRASDAPPSASQKRQEGQERPDEQEHKHLPVPQSPKLSESEKQAVDLLFSEFRRMQKAYPRSDFGRQPISPQSKTDQLLVFRVLHAVGASNVIDFLDVCARKFKGLDRNALGKQAPRSPDDPGGPRSFGLIYDWAQDYGRCLDEAAHASAEKQKQMRQSEIAACVALLGDPNEPEANKQLYRDVLNTYGVPLQMPTKGGIA